MRRLLAPALLIALTAACGGNSDASPIFHSPKDIADHAGCTSYVELTGKHIEHYAATEGACHYQGDALFLLTFRTKDDEASWVRVAHKALGGTIAVGHGFAFETYNQAQAIALARTFDGQVG
ncbi:MAG TPA: hypothetical protein VHE56_06485 [Mycobacteriales bacterium]|nr:hypothetical protein [Mycobacteriales bacterium]